MIHSAVVHLKDKQKCVLCLCACVICCMFSCSTTTSGVFFKEIATLKCQKTYVSQKSDTDFDIQYVLCSTEHCVYFNYDKCFKYKMKKYVKF